MEEKKEELSCWASLINSIAFLLSLFSSFGGALGCPAAHNPPKKKAREKQSHYSLIHSISAIQWNKLLFAFVSWSWKEKKWRELAGLVFSLGWLPCGGPPPLTHPRSNPAPAIIPPITLPRFIVQFKRIPIISILSIISILFHFSIRLGQPRCLPSFIPLISLLSINSILSLTYFYNTFLFIQFKQNQSIINNSNQMSLIGCVDWWFVCYYAPFGAAQPHNSISFVQRHKRNWELCWMASCICFIHKLIILSIWLIQRHQSNWERIDLFAHSAHLQQINTSSTHQPLNKSKLFCFVLCGGWSGLVDCCLRALPRFIVHSLNSHKAKRCMQPFTLFKFNSFSIRLVSRRPQTLLFSSLSSLGRAEVERKKRVWWPGWLARSSLQSKTNKTSFY